MNNNVIFSRLYFVIFIFSLLLPVSNYAKLVPKEISSIEKEKEKKEQQHLNREEPLQISSLESFFSSFLQFSLVLVSPILTIIGAILLATGPVGFILLGIASLITLIYIIARFLIYDYGALGAAILIHLGVQAITGIVLLIYGLIIATPLFWIMGIVLIGIALLFYLLLNLSIK